MDQLRQVKTTLTNRNSTVMIGGKPQNSIIGKRNSSYIKMDYPLDFVFQQETIDFSKMIQFSISNMDTLLKEINV